MATELTLTELHDAVPKKFKNKLSQDLVDAINGLVSDPEERAMYRDNLLSYAGVLEEGKFKLTQYLDAVRYVSYKLMNDTNIYAYRMTFPDKYADFKARGVTDETIAKYVYSYNRSKLVQLIWKQSMVPFCVFNQEARQKALNRQVWLMENAKSEMVQTTAANSVLTATKPPEEAKVEVEIGMKDSGLLSDLKEVSRRLAEQQVNAVNAGGMSAKDVVHQSIIIEGDYNEQ